ncbi:aldolase [Paenibacillus sp. YAF4_2]|uniref:aldolase n=1 Tax=Paenibacillus sp. YAF4_2 TaxID=3233085 RepID=UPI003F9E5971
MYSAYGLRMASEIDLPELWDVESGEPDVYIEFADLSDYVKDWEADRLERAGNDEVVFRVPDVANYRVVGNHLIQVMPVNGADPREYRMYILGACCAVLLVRRGMVPLHASGVVIDGKAYAILGDCGAGKSTLATAFRHAGYKLLSDDIVGVWMDERTNKLTAYPGYPQQKLWKQSLDYFHMDSDHYNPILESYDKFAVPVHDQFVHHSLPLSGIFELEKADIPRVALNPLTPLERVRLLRYHSFLDKLLKEMQMEQWLFALAVKIALAIPFYQLKRPLNGFTAPDLVNQIINTVREGEVVSL